MATKYVTSKENIAALIQEVQKTNSLITEQQPLDNFRNAALEMINNIHGQHLRDIEDWTAGNLKQLAIINQNLVAIGEYGKQHQDAILDLTTNSNYALQKINNEMVDSVENMKAMADAAEMDRLKQKELTAEQTKHNEALLAAIQNPKESPEAKKKKGDNEKDAKKGKFGAMMKDLGQGMFNAGKGLLAMGAAVWVLADAFGKFSKLSWADMSKGLVTLGALAIAGKMMGKGNGKDSWKPILAIGGAMLILAEAFRQFSKLDWSELSKGIVVLGALAIATKLMSGATGALTILAVAGAMWILGESMGKFAALDWEGLAKGVVVLGALVAAVLLLGATAPVALLGAAAMIAVAAALYIAAKAFEVIAGSMGAFVEGLERLAKVDGAGLMTTAGALGALGLAMAAFGAGQAAAGLGTLISNLLTIGQDSPVDQILKLSRAGDGLLKTADGLSRIADAMARFAAISPDTMKAINEFPWMRMTAFASAGGQMTVNGATIGKAPQASPQAPAAAELSNAQAKNAQGTTTTEVSRAEANVAAMAEGRRPSFDRARPEGGKYSQPQVVPITAQTTKWDPEDAMARGAR
jgi:hypothetical protein